MENLEKSLLNKEALYKIFRSARTAGNKNGGRDRAALIRPLLDEIVGKRCPWTEQQCARCFKRLLEKYVNEHFDLILAIAGYAEPYANLSDATKRRRKYAKDHLEDGQEPDIKTLETRENKHLSDVASRVWEDYSDNPTILLDTVLQSLTIQEVRSLGIEDLSRLETGDNEGKSIDSYTLKRTGKISNITPSDNFFVGRDSVLQSLQKGFEEGYYTQIIGGVAGKGKSRVALEYARRHADEYQIICWLNAWNEDCLVSSILKFLHIADVQVDPLTPEYIKGLFRDFFRVNQNWLIICDNAELSSSVQKAILESYLLLGEGHIITTSTIESGFKETKYHHLSTLADKNDGVLFMKNALGVKALSKKAEELTSLCEGELYALNLVATYIQQSDWVDCGTYLHLLADRGIIPGKNDLQPYSLAVFEIMMQAIAIRKKYLNDPLAKALEQLLVISSILGFCDIDFTLLSRDFPILPEPLNTVYRDKKTRTQFLEKIKELGMYEIGENVFQYNSWLRYICSEHFGASIKNRIGKDLLDKMQSEIRAIQDDSQSNSLSEILIHAKPCIDQACSYMAVFSDMNLETLKQQYPDVWALSYCHEWA